MGNFLFPPLREENYLNAKNFAQKRVWLLSYSKYGKKIKDWPKKKTVNKDDMKH